MVNFRFITACVVAVVTYFTYDHKIVPTFFTHKVIGAFTGPSPMAAVSTVTSTMTAFATVRAPTIVSMYTPLITKAIATNDTAQYTTPPYLRRAIEIVDALFFESDTPDFSLSSDTGALIFCCFIGALLLCASVGYIKTTLEAEGGIINTIPEAEAGIISRLEARIAEQDATIKEMKRDHAAALRILRHQIETQKRETQEADIALAERTLFETQTKDKAIKDLTIRLEQAHILNTAARYAADEQVQPLEVEVTRLKREKKSLQRQLDALAAELSDGASSFHQQAETRAAEAVQTAEKRMREEREKAKATIDDLGAQLRERDTELEVKRWELTLKARDIGDLQKVVGDLKMKVALRDMPSFTSQPSSSAADALRARLAAVPPTPPVTSSPPAGTPASAPREDVAPAESESASASGPINAPPAAPTPVPPPPRRRIRQPVKLFIEKKPVKK